MKKALLAAGAVLSLAMSAHAADLPKRNASPAPMSLPVFSWAGAYAGVNAGFSQSNGKTDYDYAYSHGNNTNSFADFFGNGSDSSVGPGPLNIPGLNATQSALHWGIIPASLGSNTSNGFAGGVHAGYNWQNGVFVYGVEADVSGLTKKSSGHFRAIIPFAYLNEGSASSSVTWLATARLRAGLAIDRALVYATGGLAAGGVKAASSSVGTDGFITDTYAGGIKKTRFGWAAGGGVEYAVTDRWVLRGEALYYNLGKVSYNVAAQDAETTLEGLKITARHKYDGYIVRAGLSYKF